MPINKPQLCLLGFFSHCKLCLYLMYCTVLTYAMQYCSASGDVCYVFSICYANTYTEASAPWCFEFIILWLKIYGTLTSSIPISFNLPLLKTCIEGNNVY